MNTKHYLIISSIVGGVIGSLLTALLVSPVTAQRDKFGEIECTSLRVVDAAGKTAALLSVDEDGGSVGAFGKDGKSRASLGVIEHGGFVQVKGKGEGMAVMSINEYGNGTVFTRDKNGNLLK